MPPILLILSTALFALLTPAPVATSAPLTTGETVEELWSNGNLRRRYDLDDKGRKNGNYVEYYEDGEVQLRARYRADELDGVYATFYEDGAKHVYAKYKKGKLHGKYTERLPSGDLRLTAEYDSGALDGVRAFYTGKKSSSKQRWKDGVLLDIDGLAPFPRPLAEMAEELLAIRADITPPPAPDLADEQRLAAERARGLNRLQEYRALCGVPWKDLELVEDYDVHAQWGAKLCHAIGGLNHTPDNPGWADDEYRKGYRGTSNSNLATVDDCARSIDMYMDDSDPSNIDRVGHRMHCLARTLKKTGFGSFKGYSAMWSLDRSGKAPSKDFVAYPPPGYVPVDRFGPRYAWSVRFDSGFRRVPDVKEVTVRVYELDELYARVGEPKELDHLGRIGTNALIFRPVGLTVTAGAKYWLEIDGLSGGKRGETFRYMIEFVELD
ncbi:MAG: hypothetical protein AAF682_06690 [Planctomycetota bacterium]